MKLNYLCIDKSLVILAEHYSSVIIVNNIINKLYLLLRFEFVCKQIIPRN